MKVLFYHSRFFNRSETFIYQQAINPYIKPLLLAKGFSDDINIAGHAFEKIQYRRTLWDGLISNLLQPIFIDRYYQGKSIQRLVKRIGEGHVDVIHAQFGFNAVRIVDVAIQLKLPLVVSFHGLDASQMLRHHAYRNGLRRVFHYASAIVVCNPGMADVLPLTIEQKKKVVWVPYGINLRQFDYKPREKKSLIRILHVGRLVEKKGVPDLIRAFAAINCNSSIQLDVVGTGPEEKIASAIAQQNKQSNEVAFHGWKSPEEVKQLMQLSDVFVLNSRTAKNGDSEGLPVGVLEAMSMGLPVVATRHAAIPRAVDHGMTGLLIDEHDTQALTRALTELISDEKLRHTMGEAARRKIESGFSMEQMHQQLLQVYQNA